MTLIQISALLYLLVYYGLILVFRGYILFKRTGINPIQQIEKKGIGGFIETILKCCFISIPVIVINFVFIEQNYRYLGPIEYLEIPWVASTGVVISMSGLLFTLVAQFQMGDSWRLGINQNEKTELINHGMYKYSRNPVYLCLLLSYVGFFMMMPNALSLSLVLLSYVALGVKIRLEEKYLEANYKEMYLTYKRRVSRWL